MSDQDNAARMIELRDRAVALHELLDVAGTHGHDLPAVGRLLVATLRDAEQLAAGLVGGATEGEA
jgi:hypothetical protein